MKPPIVISACWFVLHHVAWAQDFHPLGQGLNGPVYELAVHGTDLYVGGGFTDAGGNPDADYIARWDGDAWHPVGPGLTGPVRAIAFRDSFIYVGGEFTDTLNHMAVWSGSVWEPMSAGLNGVVYDLVFWREDLYAGGDFSAKVARWSGDDWVALGTSPNGPVYALAGTEAYLYVGGKFAYIGALMAKAVARWDGQDWSPVGNGLGGYVRSIQAQDEVFMAGHFGANCPERMIARWDGKHMNDFGQWCELGQAIALSGRYMYVSMYDFIGGEDRLLRWDLETDAWTYLGIWTNTGAEGAVLAILGDDLYVGGSFQDLDSPEGDHIVRWGEAVTGTTIDDPQPTPGIRVYPSPVADILKVEMPDGGDPGRLRGVFDASGMRMFVGSYRDGTLDVTGLPAGVYHVVIETTQGLRTARFMKQ